MIEIKYDGENYSFRHDGQAWDEKDLTRHLSENGHEREVVGVAISSKYVEAWKYGSDVIAKRFNTIFDKKELPVNIRSN